MLQWISLWIWNTIHMFFEKNEVFFSKNIWIIREKFIFPEQSIHNTKHRVLEQT